MPDLKKLITLEALQAALPSWLKSSSKPSYTADEISDTNTTNKFVTSADKSNWNAKGTYSKPAGGIPKTDLSSLVQSSLDKADSAVQTETDPTVPSWAKQTNKPSYTQDEVTDGTTYKRVTSTEKNSWNSKQSALTTTQMSAVNSGITSEGVTQISTNQTNILLVESMNGGKNLCNVWGRSGIVTGIKVENTDIGTVRVYGTSTGSSPAAIGLHDIITLPAGNYYFYRNRQGSSVQGTSIQYFKNNTYIASINSDTAYAFTLTEASEVQFKVYFSAGQTVDAVYKPMIITKAAYDAGFTDYQSYALGNQVLTPALIQQVDEGAKNVLDTSASALKSVTSNTEGTWNGNVYTVANVGTVTVNADNSLTVVKTGTSARLIFRLTNTNTSGSKYANMVLSGCPANGSDSTYNVIAELSVSPYTNLAKDYGAGGVIASSSSNMYVYLQLKASYTTGSGGITFKPMVCTLADWKVSQKHVPYRPDLDLIYSSLKCDVKYAKVPVSTSYSLIGSIKTKGNRVCRITVTQEYASVAPTGLILSKSNQSSDFNTLTNMIAPPVETTTDNLTLTISALCYYTYDRVVYIWAKAKTASTNGNNFMALCEHFGDIDGVKNSMN